MLDTDLLIEELAADVEGDPASWRRIGQWLNKRFIDHGTVGLRVFGGWPYHLELDASPQQAGNLDKLTFGQFIRVRAAARKWRAHKHGGIYRALSDWHQNPNVPMAAWVKKREEEILTRKDT